MKDKMSQNKEEAEIKDSTIVNSELNAENSETQSKNDDTLKNEIEELKDKYLRLYSEFDNYRRRVTKEKIEIINNAGQEILKSLLPIIDDIERAEKTLIENKEKNSADEGLFIIFNKLKNVLEQQGLKEFNSIGETFNDELHDAITKIPATNPKMKGKIVDVIEKGYKLKDKVIRFAKVIVGE